MGLEYADKLNALAELNEEAIVYHDMADALVGWVERHGHEPIAIYDYHKCIAICMDEGMEYEDAIEYLQYNTCGLWAGEGTPAFIHYFTDDEADGSSDTF